MLLQLLIAAVFFAMVISLAAGAGFLLRDNGSSRRLLTSLKWRIGLACLLAFGQASWGNSVKAHTQK